MAQCCITFELRAREGAPASTAEALRKRNEASSCICASAHTLKGNSSGLSPPAGTPRKGRVRNGLSCELDLLDRELLANLA